MSIKLMSMVWDSFPRGGGEKLVLLALADWAGDDGERIWPAIATIAGKTNMSERQVQRILSRFVDQGILEITANEHGGRNLTRHYKINVEAINGDGMSPFAEDERVTFEVGKGDICDIKGDICDIKGDTHVTQTIIDPLINHQKKKILRTARSKSSHPHKPEGVSDQTWNDFLALRKTKRAAVTPTALDEIIKQAELAGWTLERALREMCARGWAGFTAEWVDKSNGGKARSHTKEDFAKIDYGTGIQKI